MRRANRLTRHPARRVVAAAALTAALAAGPAGCGEREATEPAIPTFDTTPNVVLVVDDDGLRFTGGDGSVSTDPARWSTGTLLAVRNDGDEPHRVQGGTRFDTGVLQPGEQTLVLFDEELTAPTTITVTDDDDPSRTVTFELVPGPRP